MFSISKYTPPRQILQSERVSEFGDLVCLLNQDTCCQFVSVVLAGEQPGTRCRRQCSGRTRGRNRPTGLFVLPSFRPAVAQSERCQLEVKRWKPRPQQLPWGLVIITSPSPKTQTGRMEAKDTFGPDQFIFVSWS